MLAETGTSGVTLSAFFAGGRTAIASLLNSCQRHTRPVKPEDLGLIGARHLLRDCMALGAAEESFQYRKHLGMTRVGLPYAIEAAFAYLPYPAATREIITGVNFSSAIDNPFTRLGYFESLTGVLQSQYINADDPVAVVLHYASPVPDFSDRGKSAVTLPEEVKREVTNLIKLDHRIDGQSSAEPKYGTATPAKNRSANAPAEADPACPKRRRRPSLPAYWQ